jgi:hypothetical protein
MNIHSARFDRCVDRFLVLANPKSANREPNILPGFITLVIASCSRIHVSTSSLRAFGVPRRVRNFSYIWWPHRWDWQEARLFIGALL